MLSQTSVDHNGETVSKQNETDSEGCTASPSPSELLKMPTKTATKTDSIRGDITGDLSYENEAAVNCADSDSDECLIESLGNGLEQSDVSDRLISINEYTISNDKDDVIDAAQPGLDKTPTQGNLTPDPDAATSQSMRSSPEDSGDKAETSSMEEVKIVAMQAGQGTSQLDRSLSDMLTSAYGDDHMGSVQASDDDPQGGDSKVENPVQNNNAQHDVQASGIDEENKRLKKHVELLEAEIDRFKKTNNSQKAEVKKLTSVNDKLRKDLSCYQGIQK